MRYPFSKYEGLGNDFLVVEQARFAALTPELAANLCDRHFGIGADGVLLTGLREGRPFMAVINADGSRPEMCGNGLRCVALYLADRGLVRDVAFEVDTEAGPHFVRVTRDEKGASVQVQMRHASVEAGDVMRTHTGRHSSSRSTSMATREAERGLHGQSARGHLRRRARPARHARSAAGKRRALHRGRQRGLRQGARPGRPGAGGVGARRGLHARLRHRRLRGAVAAVENGRASAPPAIDGT